MEIRRKGNRCSDGCFALSAMCLRLRRFLSHYKLLFVPSPLYTTLVMHFRYGGADVVFVGFYNNSEDLRSVLTGT
jgi:hypothetical protein